ncbi:MAG TPA: HNH endonuclease [Opitutus sp.]|nr:HNH endonuclease [Opitutus sp.]
MVAKAFLGGPPTNTHQVNHIDGDPTNNRVENLEWVTPSANQIHAARTGLSNPVANLRFGAQHHSAKLSEEDVRTIRTLLGSMSQQAIADRFGIGQVSVSRIALGKNWKHVV